MVKRSIVVLFVLSVLLCVCSTNGAAQSSRSCGSGWPCQINNNNWACEPVPPPTAHDPVNSAPWAFVYQVNTAGCYAGNPEEPCPRCTTAGKPISLSTGNTVIEETDVSMLGLGGGLNLMRTWNSKLPPVQGLSGVGIFGPNWRSTYEERVFIGSDGYYKYARGDGSVWSLGFAASLGETATQASFKYAVVAPANGGGGASMTITITNNSASLSWPLTFGNGEQRLFDNNSGKLVAIVDRHGNKTPVSYESSGRLATVTDAGQRHLYFNYPTGGTLVTSVTSDFGITLSYSYDTQGRLAQVTRPDQSTVAFTYDGQSMITAERQCPRKEFRIAPQRQAGGERARLSPARG